MPVLSDPSAADAVSASNFTAWRSQLAAFSYRHATDLFAAERAMLAEIGADLAQARLLDIGIGTGRTTGHLAPRARSYVGIDYSSAMIERARQRYPACRLEVMDARDLSAFATGSFDVAVFSYNGLDYVGHEDRLLVLAEIRRVLEPGGFFLFSAHRRGVVIPPATSLANLRLSLNPVRAVHGAARYLQGVLNARRLKRRELQSSDYALLNDPAQQYQLLTYYITPAAQARQLVQLGFTGVRAFELSGREIGRGADNAPPPATDYMVHYLARR